ncbi:MAG: hypothetical protein GVY18_18335 [Bacteroidetes bacterium]|jgi:hypothetical protein|nr:hypothetical protein [Bacteroidota bacterium]
MNRLLLPFLLLLALPCTTLAQETTPDHDGVRQAVLDYVEALYLVDSTRIVRSVHPSLRKHGYWRPDSNAAYRDAPMTYDQLKALATRWNVDQQRADPATAPKRITIYEVLDKTAVAKLEASWGIDFFQLAKIDGRWQIMNVLWQSYPLAQDATDDM